MKFLILNLRGRFILEKTSRCRKVFLPLLILVFSSVHAAAGDISLFASSPFNHTAYSYDGLYYRSHSYRKVSFGLSNFNFPFRNSNVGFFEGVAFCFSDDLSVDFFTGPAFSFDAEPWVCVQFGPSFLFNFRKRNYSFSDVSQFSFGIMNDFRLKFFPYRMFSVSLGLDLSCLFVCYQVERTSAYTSYWYLDDFLGLNLSPFAAISFNFP